MEPAQEEFRFQLDDRFRELDISQQSIEKFSHYLLNVDNSKLSRELHVSIVVEVWARYFLRVHRARKVAFMYLANDVI